MKMRINLHGDIQLPTEVKVPMQSNGFHNFLKKENNQFSKGTTEARQMKSNSAPLLMKIYATEYAWMEGCCLIFGLDGV